MAVQSAKQTLPAKGISRREFLFYLGGASLALSGAGACSIATWFATPQRRWGVDIFRITQSMIPAVGAEAVYLRDPYVYLVQLEEGLIALSARCTFLDRYGLKWERGEDRYACPGCGTQYRKDGTYIAGPSERGMDRLALEVITTSGEFHISSDGAPIDVSDARQIVLDVNNITLGQSRCQVYPFREGCK